MPLTLVLFSSLALAADEQILPPEQAFKYQAVAGPEAIELRWDIAEGYYMYRGRMGYESLSSDVSLGTVEYPAGKVKDDQFFGRVETYRGAQVLSIPYQAGSGGQTLELQIKSQGCADIGLCFPPQTWTTTVALPVVKTALGGPSAAGTTSSGGGNPLADLFAGDTPAQGSGQFLPPEEAFRLDAIMVDPYTVQATWTIADGYYLYRDKFGFETDSQLAQLGAAQLPPGKEKFDEHFGQVRVFYQKAQALIPISRANAQAGDFAITTQFQGCAEDGICYPPMTRDTLVWMPAATASDAPSALAATAAAAAAPAQSEQDRLASVINDGNLALVLGIFFGSGLLLAFTPCILPMVPILSGIIVGQGPDLGTGRAFALSLVYVLAMALTYTVAGVVTAMLGQNLQAVFQHPGVIIGFSVVFVLLALAMFDVYELQMPASIQARLTNISNNQQGGQLAGVGVMGVLSALIVGPCVAAPLAAALIVIGQGGDPVRGGLALFSLSLGMGAPLVAFGTSAGTLVPKAGAWMDRIKKMFGILMLGVAVWMLSRIIPGIYTMVAWALLALAAGTILGGFIPRGQKVPMLMRGVGAVILAYGAVLMTGAATGSTNPLAPLSKELPHLEFERVKTVAELEQRVREASASGQHVMLDFYADWCVSCIEMEKFTFTNPQVQQALANTLLLQADVTANDEHDQAMLKYFGIFGPPTIAFFGPDGTEREAFRVVGFMPADRFHPHVQRLLGTSSLASAGGPR